MHNSQLNNPPWPPEHPLFRPCSGLGCRTAPPAACWADASLLPLVPAVAAAARWPALPPAQRLPWSASLDAGLLHSVRCESKCQNVVLERSGNEGEGCRSGGSTGWRQEGQHRQMPRMSGLLKRVEWQLLLNRRPHSGEAEMTHESGHPLRALLGCFRVQNGF